MFFSQNVTISGQQTKTLKSSTYMQGLFNQKQNQLIPQGQSIGSTQPPIIWTQSIPISISGSQGQLPIYNSKDNRANKDQQILQSKTMPASIKNPQIQLKYLHEASGAMNTKESFKASQRETVTTPVLQSNSYLSTENLLAPQKQTQNSQKNAFAQTYPRNSSDIADSPKRNFQEKTQKQNSSMNLHKGITSVSSKKLYQNSNNKTPKGYMNTSHSVQVQRSSNYNKRQSTSVLKEAEEGKNSISTGSAKKTSIDIGSDFRGFLDLDLKKQTKHLPDSPRDLIGNFNRSNPNRRKEGLQLQSQTNPYPAKVKNTLYITPADTNIIEENPLQEDHGDIEQVQGQGCEQEKDDSFEIDGVQRRRKSITLFEMHYNTIQNDLLNEFYQKTIDDDQSDEFEDEEKLENMKRVIERLSNRPGIILEKAKRFKVVINGPFEESEFHIDIGSIPQIWKLKQLANILNKMYNVQHENKFELKNPVISKLSGRVHTEVLDQNLKIFELIDLAAQGELGQDHLLVLEENQTIQSNII